MLGPTRSTPTVCTPKGTWTTALPTRSPPFDSTSRTSCSPSRLGDERVILPEQRALILARYRGALEAERATDSEVRRAVTQMQADLTESR
jgi:hypothetical protein